MRKKEGLADYRYFPEPDLPEVVLNNDYIDEIRKSMPELPEAKRRRYENMGLSMQDVLFLANDDNVISSMFTDNFDISIHFLPVAGYLVEIFHFIRLGRGAHILLALIFTVHRQCSKTNFPLKDNTIHFSALFTIAIVI